MPSRMSGAIVVVLAVVAASCSSNSRPSDAELRLSGVGVVAEGCSLVAHLASGVVVGRPGQVVTVAHAIAGAASISVIDDAGDAHAATVRAFDKDSDLAMLDVPGLAAPALQIAPSAVGRGSMLTWNREAGVMNDEVTVSKLLTVTIEDIYVEESAARRGLEVLGEVHAGDSGGAVLSSTGDVIGIIYARSRTRNGVGFATDASELDVLLHTPSATPVANGRCG